MNYRRWKKWLAATLATLAVTGCASWRSGGRIPRSALDDVKNDSLFVSKRAGSAQANTPSSAVAKSGEPNKSAAVQTPEKLPATKPGDTGPVAKASVPVGKSVGKTSNVIKASDSGAATAGKTPAPGKTPGEKPFDPVTAATKAKESAALPPRKSLTKSDSPVPATADVKPSAIAANKLTPATPDSLTVIDPAGDQLTVLDAKLGLSREKPAAPPNSAAPVAQVATPQMEKPALAQQAPTPTPKPLDDLPPPPSLEPSTAKAVDAPRPQKPLVTSRSTTKPSPVVDATKPTVIDAPAKPTAPTPPAPKQDLTNVNSLAQKPSVNAMTSVSAKPVEPTTIKSDGNPLPTPPIAKPTTDVPKPIANMPGAIAVKPPEKFEIARLALCSQVSGFGEFDPLPTDKLQPGQMIMVYTELKNFESRESGGRFSTLIGSEIQLETTAGVTVSKIQFDDIIDQCLARRRDFFCHHTFAVPESLPPGEYTLRVRMQDRTTGQTHERKLTVTTVAGESTVASAATDARN